MKIAQNCYNNQTFTGRTRIYAITDSHQETRKTCAFLSKILHDTKGQNNALFLSCGDIFKGIYPREMERDCYIKLKKEKPDLEMVMTLGNNDFGFNKESLEFLIDTVKNFGLNGIKMICANIFNPNGLRPDWINPYTVVERDGDKTFITGFCIDNINATKFGIIPKKQEEVLDEIQKAILEEKPDNVILLNHDYMHVSQDIVDICQKKGIKINLTIGGHDHEFVPADNKRNIFYPQPFSDSMYKMDLIKDESFHDVKNIENIKVQDLEVDKLFAFELEQYEKNSGLLENIVPSVLNLTKEYSNPCPLGSFLADEMKRVSGSDIAFFSTGFLMKPMEYKPDSFITNYLFQKTMTAGTPIKMIELTTEDIKNVFQHALKTQGYGISNPKFLQCSNNIKIVGKDNKELGVWEVKQIYIDNEPILDENSMPKVSGRKYKCVVDSYISDGGQGFKLQEFEKKDVIVEGNPIKISDVLMDGLKEAPLKYEKGFTYPCFELITL